MSKKYSVTIEGFSSKAEAEEFITWYSEAGETDSNIWFEERQREGKIEHSNMQVDGAKTWDYSNRIPGEELKFLKETDTNTTMHLKLYK